MRRAPGSGWSSSAPGCRACSPRSGWEAGIDCVVLEKNDDVGGTWLENGYPGAGVDTPSHLYSFSFAPKQWTTHFGKRDEVLAYLREVADRYDLRGMIRFGTEAAGAVYARRSAGRYAPRPARSSKRTP